MKEVSQISFFECEWNCWNGFFFSICYISSGTINGSLFAFGCGGRDYMTIELFFKHFTIYGRN